MSDATIPRRGPARPSDAGWRAVAAAFAFNGFFFGLWASRIPAVQDRLGLDKAQLGLVLLCLAGGAIAAFPLAGRLSERWGPHRTTLRAALLHLPAIMVLALAPSPWALAAALFLFGALHGGMDVAMNGWAARVEERLDRPTMSLFHATFSLGAGLGAASGFGAVALGLGPAAHFALLAGGAAIVALPVMRMGSSGHVHAATGPDAPLFARPRGPLLLVGLVAFGIAMGEGAMADWSAVFLASILEAGEGTAALGYAAFSAAMVAARLLGDRATARLGPAGVARASGLVAAAGLAVLIAAPTVPVALTGFALVGMGYAVVVPLAFGRAARDPDLASGPAIASVATLAYGGMLLGPGAIGLLAAATSLPAAFGVLLALALLSAGLAGHLRTGPAR